MVQQAPDFKAVAAKLPTGHDAESNKKRDELFKAFDVNSNHKLSLAEVDKGLRDVLQIEDIYDVKPVIIRAFEMARMAGPKPDDYIERREFRLLLLYLENFFVVWEIFASADSSGDHRLTRDEFDKIVPQLQKWAGGKSGEEMWKSCDTEGGKNLLFSEFAHWAIPLELKSSEALGSQ